MVDKKWLIGTSIAGLALISSFIVPEVRCFLRLSNECEFDIIEIVVIDNKTNQSLEKVQVRSEFKGAPESQETDANGYTQIKIPKSEAVKIYLAKEGFKNKTYTVNPAIPSSTLRRIPLEKELVSQEPSIADEVNLDIIILTQESEPLEGVKIQLLGLETQLTNSDGLVKVKIPRRDKIDARISKEGYISLTQIIDDFSNKSIIMKKYYLEKVRKDSLPVDPLTNNIISQSPDDPAKNNSTEEIVKSFKDYIDAWNKKDYQKQVQYLSSDFVSTSFDKGCKYDGPLYYEEFLRRKKQIIEDEGVNITVNESSIKYIPTSDGIIVRYYQKYSSSSGYESWGTNDVYFKNINGSIKIIKEIFNRDGCRNCKQVSCKN